MKVPGVREASVNFATESAHVTHDPAVTPSVLIQAVESAGYHAVPRESKRPSEQAENDHERLRLVLAAALTAPAVTLSMAWPMRPEWTNWILLALVTPVVLYCGRDFFVNGWRAARQGAATMDTLVAVGAGVAWAASIYGLLSGTGQVYFESAAVIVTLILLGRRLESNARRSMTRAIGSLLDLSPKMASLVVPGASDRQVPSAQLRIGDLVRIRPGEQAATDGEVVEGESYFDESLLTGEPSPVHRIAGDRISGGTLSGKGSVVYRVGRPVSESRPAQIARLVAQSQATKAPIQSLADRIAAIFVPAVVAVAALTFGIRLFGLHESAMAAILPAIAVLVVACPCAMGLAAPAAIVAGIGRGARLGMLIRDGATLQRAASIRTILFDKTGTLTEGRPSVVSAIQSPLALAASVEVHSEHPLGKAVVEAAHEEEIALLPSADFRAHPGQGVEATVEGHRVAVGSPRFVGGLPQALQTLAAESEAKGHTVVAVARDGEPVGLIAIGDSIRPESADAVKELRALGIEPVMLTGDRKATAQAVAQEVGIDAVEAELLPEDKAAVASRYAKRGPVAMAGDGINDAPALAAADVGIALGAGSDVAKETAGIVLLRNDLRIIPQAIRLSRAATATIRTNLAWAFVYNIAAIPIAASGHLDPMIAAGAMAFSSLSVMLNSLRLVRFR